MFKHAGTHARAIAIVLLCLLTGACVTFTGWKAKTANRGIVFNHERHLKENMACTDCHAAESANMALPGHDTCSTCHEFNIDKPDPKVCGMCHADPDCTVKPRTKLFKEEVIFTHEPHAAKDVKCESCHATPNQQVKTVSGDKMAMCEECHAKLAPEKNKCSVCHKELSKEKRPTMRGASRIMHDAPQIWNDVHGRESQKDPDYCAKCHDKESSCEACHRITPPKSHTLAWRNKTHGMRAEWDRKRCETCHEEDFCIKCHRNTTPTSHRGGWGYPVNQHCRTCHFPPEETNCTVCHEKIEHRGALASPHVAGLYPTPCSACHPAGLTNRPPHPQNSSVACVVCHDEPGKMFK